MRIVFLGTPGFAVPTLERIIQAGHFVLAVFTQPDRPKGRGGKLTSSPVKDAALRHGIPVYQPERIRRAEAVQQLTELSPDAMVIVGYGQIIPQSIIDIPAAGILNVHASLLPKYRGAAPIQWAVANEEPVTGVTTMRIDAGLDTGDMLLKWSTPVSPEENAIDLGARLARAGADLLVKTLEALEGGTLRPEPQMDQDASYAPVLTREHGRISWSDRATRVAAQSRGFLPWPGTWTKFRGQLLHIWKAKPANHISSGVPGSMIAAEGRLLVACGEGTVLELEELQLEGRKRLSAQAFCNGQRLAKHEMLGENIL